MLGEVIGKSEEDVAALTTANFYRLFDRAKHAHALTGLQRDGFPVTIIGCGVVGGVPRVGMGWGACDPQNPKNRRRRCSILVEGSARWAKTSVLIDTSPDLREQLLDAEVMKLDAVLFTHEHADHTHGIDDLRPLVIKMRRRIPIYADRMTSEMLLTRFSYCFQAPPGSQYPPILSRIRLLPDAW